MTNKEIRNSLAKQLSSPISDKTFKVKTTTTTIKEYNAGDLPAYFKWDKGLGDWFFRARVREGMIVCDLLKPTTKGLELTYATIDSTFHQDNKAITEDEWRNEMHKFINQIKN
jgi:hypothetical protein